MNAEVFRKHFLALLDAHPATTGSDFDRRVARANALERAAQVTDDQIGSVPPETAAAEFFAWAYPGFLDPVGPKPAWVAAEEERQRTKALRWIAGDQLFGTMPEPRHVDSFRIRGLVCSVDGGRLALTDAGIAELARLAP